MKRAIVGMVFVAVLGGCTGGTPDETPDSGARSTRAEKKERSPQPPQQVAAKKVDSNLSLKQVAPCLYDEQIPISELAGQYYGPQDLVAGEVEAAREIDFTVPGEIKMLEKKAFGDELKSARIKHTRKQKKVNQWIEWNLGYRPFSKRGEPSGKGTDLIAGFYDPKSEEVIVQQEGELDSEYIVLAHEFAHAAVDQRFGLSKKYSPLAIDDKELAYAALVEGDATLTEYRVTSRLGKRSALNKAIKALLKSEKQFKKDAAAGVPHAATDRFVFPYRWGTPFVCKVVRKEGWKGVNRAHSRHPTTTAEIMFPERFLNRERPKQPAPLKAPKKPWRLYAKGTIGAAHLKALFEAPGDRKHRALNNSLGRAAAWNGGTYRLWARSLGNVNSIFGMSFVEYERHEGVLCSSLIKWYEATYGTADREVLDDDVVGYTDSLRGGVIDCRGRRVKVAIAPELEQAERVIGV